MTLGEETAFMWRTYLRNVEMGKVEEHEEHNVSTEILYTTELSKLGNLEQGI